MLSSASPWLAFKFFKHQIFTDVTQLLTKLNFKGPYPAASVCAHLPSKAVPCISNANEPAPFRSYFLTFLCSPLLPWFTTILWVLLMQTAVSGCLAWVYTAVLHLGFQTRRVLACSSSSLPSKRHNPQPATAQSSAPTLSCAQCQRGSMSAAPLHGWGFWSCKKPPGAVHVHLGSF